MRCAEQVHGASSPEAWLARYNLAEGLAGAGRLAEAIELQCRVLAERVARLGIDDPTSLTAPTSIALMLTLAGHLETSVLIHRHVVAARAGRQDLAGLPHEDVLRLAATVMRNILIDRARARASRKRGGQAQKRSLDALDLATAGSFEDILSLDEAIERLRAHDPTMAELVRLRFFVGLTIEETAQALAISVRTVNRDWQLAMAFLLRLLQSGA